MQPDFNILVSGVLCSALFSLLIPKIWPKTKARCILYRNEHNVVGKIELFSVRNKTVILCEIRGLTPGWHGLHVHNKADFSQGCESTCSHYNPDDKDHGGPVGSNRHRGDFGNIEADENGVSNSSVVADVTLSELIGRAFLVHADPDDLGLGENTGSKKTGNAGVRLACGKIYWL